jgi:hypothetical protein
MKYKKLKLLSTSLFTFWCLAACATSSTTTESNDKEGVTSSVENSPTTSSVYQREYQFGDIGPSGGRIFFVSNDVQPWGKYLEAFPETGGSYPADGYLEWGCYGKLEIGETGLKIGEGRSNTDLAVLNGCNENVRGKSSIFGKIPDGSDWYLPSLAEMNELMKLDREQSIEMGFGDSMYWTSSSDDPTSAWTTNGETMEKADKSDSYAYWLIRNF